MYADLATKVNIIIRNFCYLHIYLFFKKNAMKVGVGDLTFFLALGSKLASYESEEKHGLPNTDFHETHA